MAPKNKTRKRRNKKIYFPDYPEFKPNLSPEEIETKEGNAKLLTLGADGIKAYLSAL